MGTGLRLRMPPELLDGGNLHEGVARMNRRRLTNLAVNGALALAVTVAGLGLVEAWFRYRPGAVKPFYLMDDELGWVHRPNLRVANPIEGVAVTVETDARGMRPPFHPNDAGGLPRVLLLGDSFADGMEVNAADHFATLIQRDRTHLEIHNGAVAAYSTLQEVLLARRLEPRLRPAARVLFVYANDVHDNPSPYFPLLGPRPWIDLDGRRRPVEWDLFAPSLPPVPFAVWLHRHSVAFVRAETAWARHRRAAEAARAWSWANRWPLAQRWAVLRDLVGELGTMGPLLLVACPAKGEVERRTSPTSTNVVAIGTALGIPVVDLSGVLRPEHFWRENIHWNAEGHRVVAAAVVPALDALLARASSATRDRGS